MSISIIDVIAVLLVTLGPLKAMIVYATQTAGADAALKRRIAVKSVAVAALVALLFVVAGEFILGVLHISLAALKIAGGVILLQFALGMIMGSERAGDSDRPKVVSSDIAIYPLAMPMIATPQGLVAVTTITAAVTGPAYLAIVAVIVAAIMAFNLVCLLAADQIVKFLGSATLQIVTKIAGLLLAALAIQLMILGLADLGLIDKARVIG